MRYKTQTKVIISFNDLDHASSFIKVITAWFRRASAGGDAAILIGDGNPGKDKTQTGTICGVVGHDVRMPKNIEHIMTVQDAVDEINWQKKLI